MNGYRTRPAAGVGGGRRGFTLIELLTVVAIITLLMGILLPSLGKARDAAKNTKTRSIMKAIGDGLELFRNENEKELRGQNYPPSTAGHDPTEQTDSSTPGNEGMSGAQWVVRYLMGKKLDGYVARDTVPAAFFNPPPQPGWEQKGWYDDPNSPNWPTGGPTAPLERRGPYVNGLTVKPPKDLPNSLKGEDDPSPRYNNPVFVDTFAMPILYYAANTREANKTNGSITAYKGPPSQYAGVYTYLDNALFTGLCWEGSCDPTYPPWDLGGGSPKLDYGPEDWTTSTTAPVWKDVVASHTTSFPYYIMDRGAFDASNNNTVVPLRRDSFILISPGKDGIFGTKDDVTNFQ